MLDKVSEYGIIALIAYIVIKESFTLVKNVIAKRGNGHSKSDGYVRISSCPLSNEGVIKTINSIEKTQSSVMGLLQWLKQHHQSTESDYKIAITKIGESHIISNDLKGYMQATQIAFTQMNTNLEGILKVLKNGGSRQ